MNLVVAPEVLHLSTIGTISGVSACQAEELSTNAKDTSRETYDPRFLRDLLDHDFNLAGLGVLVVFIARGERRVFRWVTTS